MITDNIVSVRSVLDKITKDAARFNYLNNMPRLEAQALFWQYSSRKELAKAIDKLMEKNRNE